MIKIALKELFCAGEVSEIPRSAMKSRLGIAVTNNQFKCDKMWYTQLDIFAIGASLAVNF